MKNRPKPRTSRLVPTRRRQFFFLRSRSYRCDTAGETLFVFFQCSVYLETDKEVFTLYIFQHQGTILLLPPDRLLSILFAQKSHLLSIKAHESKYTSLKKVPIKVCIYSYKRNALRKRSAPHTM